MNSLSTETPPQTNNAQQALWAEEALLPTGWAKQVLFVWDKSGTLHQVSPNTPYPIQWNGSAIPKAKILIPGMTNLHSHAFQRVMAGQTEYRGETQTTLHHSTHPTSPPITDHFWSWREKMYGIAGRVTPSQLRDIATWLYIEMLEAGYTSVCEFHYVHHAINTPSTGIPSQSLDMSNSLIEAAKASGIRLTLLPVLYMVSGFGAHTATARQSRFIHSVESYLRLYQALQQEIKNSHQDSIRLGAAPHSLRAVPATALIDLITQLNQKDPSAPIHIHIAEQPQEVQDCIAHTRLRPVAWLLENLPVNSRWCLVHATHIDEEETQAIARSKAIIGLCPSTEANLGDGTFDLLGWQQSAGDWGIGSDSHVLVNPAEELMLLEYEHRLRLGQRNILIAPPYHDTASTLWSQAVAGGASAAGQATKGLCPGQQADWIILDDQ